MPSLELAGRRPLPPHNHLNDGTPNGWQGMTKTISILISFKIDDQNNLIFPSDISFENIEHYPVPDENDPIMCAITEDCYIRFTLSDQPWRLSPTNPPLTTKLRKSHLYGDVDHMSEKVCVIKANFDERGKYDDPSGLHGFNLNVEMKQPNGSYLPVTIDPDIRNPSRPNGLVSEDIKYRFLPAGKRGES
jgi:hypothetical protein